MMNLVYITNKQTKLITNLNVIKAKLKEERDAKRSTLDDRHYHIFQIVADRLGLDKNEVEEASLDGNQVNTSSSKFFFSYIILFKHFF